MSNTTANERRSEPLAFVTLRSGSAKTEVWDVHRNVIRVTSYTAGGKAVVGERPVNDLDRWLLSKIAATIDSEMFG